jgi:hypothetical protein
LTNCFDALRNVRIERVVSQPEHEMSNREAVRNEGSADEGNLMAARADGPSAWPNAAAVLEVLAALEEEFSSVLGRRISAQLTEPSSG